MILYLDSSAIVKLIQTERESAALARFLDSSRLRRATSWLARVEVVRAMAPGGSDAVGHARRELDRMLQLELGVDVLDDAASLLPGTLLRSLDAIHLASARSLGSELAAVVTYDRRMAEAAQALGIVAESPGTG